MNLKWVFIGGMIRSGSTLQYQIVGDLVGRDLGGTVLGFKDATELDAFLDSCEDDPAVQFPCVVKSHVCTDGIRERLGRGDSTAFYTYRDIRDVVVSGSRNFSITIDEFISGRLIDEAIGESYLWRSAPSVHRSSFETLMRDTSGWITGILEHLGVPDREGTRLAELVETYSIEHQRKRIEAASFDDAHGYETSPVSLLHRHHIDQAAIGGWRSLLSPEQVEEVECRSCDWLAENGYEPADPNGQFPIERFQSALRTRMARYFQQSDFILLEREKLLKDQAVAADVLRTGMIEMEAAFKKVKNEPQSPYLWLSLLYRKFRERQAKGSLPQS